jgi:hypothetical protein
MNVIHRRAYEWKPYQAVRYSDKSRSSSLHRSGEIWPEVPATSQRLQGTSVKPGGAPRNPGGMGITPAGLPTVNPVGQKEQPLLLLLFGGVLGRYNGRNNGQERTNCETRRPQVANEASSRIAHITKILSPLNNPHNNKAYRENIVPYFTDRKQHCLCVDGLNIVVEDCEDNGRNVVRRRELHGFFACVLFCESTAK